MRKKKFTNLFRGWTMAAVLFTLSCISVFAQDIPYPVWFDLCDQPELQSYSNFRKGTGATFHDTTLTGYSWVSTRTQTAWYGTTLTTTGGGSNDTYAFGDQLDFNFRDMSIWRVKLPYLKAGTYQFWVGYRGQANYVFVDSIKVLNPGIDTVKQDFGSSAYLTIGNWNASRAYTTPTKNIKAAQLCNIKIAKDGSFWLQFHLRNATNAGSTLAFGMDQFHFFPLKTIKSSYSGLDTMVLRDANNLTTVFDIAGNMNPTTAVKTIASGYNLSYQAIDSSVYTKYNVTVKYGNYFADQPVIIYRNEDRWTRMVVDTLPANGDLACALSAGTYYYKVKGGLGKGVFTVSSEGQVFDFIVNSYNVTINAGQETWTIGSTINVYDYATKTVLAASATVGSDGLAIVNILPGQYYYTINGKFANGSFTVVDNALTVDATKAKHNVTFKFGSESWYANKSFKVLLNADQSIAMYDVTADANGQVVVPLPDQKYYYNASNGFKVDTFTVAGNDLVFDYTARYNAIFNVGNIVNGYTLNLYRNDTIKVSSNNTIASGALTIASLPNGSYNFRLFSVSGNDTTWATKKYTFDIASANYVFGDASDLNSALVLPYPVYFDIANQSEIKWGTSGQVFTQGTLAGIKTTSTNDITYTYTATNTDVKNQYINGDFLSIVFGNATLPAAVTFTTPWINKGRYNVYINQRFNADANKPKIDTTYLDGIQLKTFDGITRTFANSSGTGATRVVTAGGAGELAALHLGVVDIPTSGRHELKLVSNAGSTTAAWLDMLFFVPVDKDVAINGTYYPRFSMTGQAVLAAGGSYTTDNGSTGQNHAETYQVADSSVVTTSNLDVTKTLTVTDAGSWSTGDSIYIYKKADNWTRINKTIVPNPTYTLKVRPEGFNFLVKGEGLSGSFSMADDYTLTLPASIPTKVEGKYDVKASETDLTKYNLKYFLKVSMDYANSLNLAVDTIFGTVDMTFTYTDPTNGSTTDVLDPFEAGISDTTAITDYFTGSDITANAAYQGKKRYAPYSANLTKVDDLSTGIVANKSVNLRVYPNPVKDVLNIQMVKAGTQDSYSIYNAMGKLVATGVINNGKASVSLGKQAAGIYIIKIKSGTDVTTAKLIKQ